MSLQAVGRLGRKRGKQDIDIHLLKPAWFAIDAGYAIPPSDSLCLVHNDMQGPGEEYLTYTYHCAHPVDWFKSLLRIEPPPQLGPKQGAKWTVTKLNAILIHNDVGGPHGHLHTFGCIQWECELFHGWPKARCYPFDIPGHHFRNKNQKVHATYNFAQLCSQYRIWYRIRYHIPYRSHWIQISYV